jgi:alpha-amylase/alpha-mannosidase (GH57 family)
MDKYVCIHGHFYQPPRENAWLEEIELQDSAQPFHDWNERIAHECYGPNGASRILDESHHIIDILNNYTKISFNFGPTLLHWMEIHNREAYEKILIADKESIKLFSGHGSAMAQVYNHIIMPLANRRDKETQVKWGIADFEHRFGRKPEGMWLAETAVDTETLEVLCENGITFTVLAPRQASKVRKLGKNDWTDVSHDKIDTRRPYLCKLPSGKTIALFFYDGESSQAVAFKGILSDGKVFAQQLLDGFSENGENEQLVHIATDGESYGHHHKHGDMALAFCLDYIEKNNLAKVINYGAYLEKFPPTWEVEIFENSSWSCVHGVERWRSDCGCSSGMNPGWHQKWRAPLRESLDWLRDKLLNVYDKEISRYLKKAWEARNEYIHVVLDRSDENVDRFLKKYCGQIPVGHHKTRVLRLLEMQRNAMLMYTSCGWFFDEISGIETTQILQYADRAIQLAESESSVVLGKEFLARLKTAPSNIPQLKNGAEVHRQYVQPSRLTLSKVGCHYAVASLFEEYPENLVICNYRAESEIYERREAGLLKLAVGKTKVHSIVTYSVKQFYFAAIYLGQNHIIGNFSSFMEDDDFQSMRSEIDTAFLESRVADVIGIMQTYFGPDKFSLWSLFKDEQRKVLHQIIQKDLQQADDAYRNILNRNYNIMSVLKKNNLPVPVILRRNLETVINSDIRQIFENGKINYSKLEKLAQDCITWDISLDKEVISFAASFKIKSMIESLQFSDDEIKDLDTLIRVLSTLESLQIELDVWEIQNSYFIKANEAIGFQKKYEKAHIPSTHWMMRYRQVGEYLKLKLLVLEEVVV